MVQVAQDVSLAAHNTLRVAATARYYVRLDTACAATAAEQLAELLSQPRLRDLPRLVLGGGSNVLFVGDYPGVVVAPAATGIELQDESADQVTLAVAAGHDWHRLVRHCVQRGWGGIENLSLIPGSVGAAPIQNIGAYGAQLSDVFVDLEAVPLDVLGGPRTMDAAACGFGYRDSVFKRELRDRMLITRVRLRLDRRPRLRLDYPGLRDELAAIGSGDASGAGDAAAVGGAAGVGGAPGIGGASGSGDAPGAGDAAAVGGAAGVGGAPGIGGASGSGGAPGVGGASGSGDAPGIGGASGSGGTPEVGGASGSGGTPEVGGASGVGDAPGVGGTPEVGGAAGRRSAVDVVTGADAGAAERWSVAAVSEAVIRLRRRKLPDPQRLPNAGSFFKNPVVSAAAFEAARARCPELAGQPVAGGVKLWAAQLIEHCGLRGRRFGRAGVAAQHALVLVNHGGATGGELLAAAQAVTERVVERFGVELEPEVRVIQGERR